MNLFYASADDPLSHVVPHALHRDPLFTVQVGGPDLDIPALFIKDGVYGFYVTNHLAMTAVTAVVVILVMAYVASRIRVKGEGLEAYQTKGRLAQMFETVCWFIRDEVTRPNLHGLTDKYIPYIWSVFFFILFANVLGLIPTSFTTTSHIAVTAVMALAVFFTVTAIGFIKNGARFLELFWVSSAPLALRPILAVIELISYFVRPVSHSVRLAGAIMAGHAVMKVFAGFAALAAVAPLAIGGMVAIYGLELLVAFIQAYVFTILTCVYLKDALHPHH